MKRLLVILIGFISGKAKQQPEPEFLGYESYVPVSTFRSTPVQATRGQDVEYRKAA
jgi:hypothetical protein